VKNLDETKPSWVTALLYAAPYQHVVGTMERANWLSTNVSDGPQKDILLMDTRTGRKNSRFSLYAVVPPLPGIVVNNPRARIGYATTNKWAQQLSVAASSYVPYLPDAGFYLTGARPTNLVRQPWREYYWSLSAPTVMLFHPAEAGKTVSVTYLDSNNQRQTYVLIIDNDIDATAPAGCLNPAGLHAAKTELTHSARSILSVKGLAVQARSAWVAGGRYTQAVASDFRKN
jgi:hypothetical protein